MYKHVTLRRRVIKGLNTWKLVGPDGQPIEAFDAFAHSLRKAPDNTRNSYCHHLAEFIDYLIEATELQGGGRQLTKLELTETLEAYGEYLQLGVDATNPIAQAVAKSLLPKPNKASSVMPKKAALRRFLELSESVRKEMQQLARLYKHREPVEETALLPELGQKRPLTVQEVRALQANSMLGGVIAGGPKLIGSVVLDNDSDDAPYDQNRAFPYDKVMDLIDDMPTRRDKTFYALLAACGGRTHEVLQVLGEDIDVREGTVRLVDPGTRQWHPSYRALLPEQRQRLAWKGRVTDLTLLIEPFASAFFESLKGYLDEEHLAHGKHDFLLQYLTDEQRGMTKSYSWEIVVRLKRPSRALPQLRGERLRSGLRYVDDVALGAAISASLSSNHTEGLPGCGGQKVSQGSCSMYTWSDAGLSTGAGGRRLRRTHDRRGGQAVYNDAKGGSAAVRSRFTLGGAAQCARQSVSMAGREP